ncbi:MAG: hypothetical protein JOZ36_10670 [Acidobacteria bacterium]|nr:hypothetical protein [Acidobacteriota bacterium]
MAKSGCSGYNYQDFAMPMGQNSNSRLPVSRLEFLVCPRRHLAILPSQARPNLFGSD